jgi:hypothetical protein
VGLLCVGAAITWSGAALAQTAASSYFPTGIFGYDQDLGVTVLSRARPLYEERGVQIGGFIVRPGINQAIFDNSNVNGSSGPSSASGGLETSGGVSGSSNWSRNSLRATVGFDHYQFFSLPNENYTNWNVGLGAGYTIGDHQLTVAYAHSTYNQLGTTIGLARSYAPVTDTIDSAELRYTIDFGRFTLTPSLAFSAYRFGDIVLGDLRESQATLNRNVVAGGIVTRYALTGSTGLLFVVRGSGSNYTVRPPDTLNNDSTSVMLLGGLDFQANSIWHYSLLAGVETRFFGAAQTNPYTAPILSADIVYTPTGVLTVTGSATRLIEDPSAAGNSGYVLTQGNLVIDYELMRNILLEGRAGFQNAVYLGGGTQNNVTIGGGVTWLINQYMRLTLNDDFTNQTSPSGNAGAQDTSTLTGLSGAFTQNTIMLTLHFGL